MYCVLPSHRVKATRAGVHRINICVQFDGLGIYIVSISCTCANVKQSIILVMWSNLSAVLDLKKLNRSKGEGRTLGKQGYKIRIDFDIQSTIFDAPVVKRPFLQGPDLAH